MKTTLTEILKHNPSERLRQKLSLTNSTGYIEFIAILNAVGIRNAIWFLKVLDYKDYCLFLADVAESVLPIFEAEYPDIKEPRKAIDGIRAWHNGDIDNEQLNILSNAAFDAAYNAAATYAAYDAAFYAAAAAAAETIYNATAYEAYNKTVYAAACAGLDWEKIEELFIKHFGDRQ